MEQRKNAKLLKILIITISIMILVLIGVIAYLYFQTDMFKSNKTLFFKYVAQSGNAETGFIDNQTTQYFEKKENTPYTNSATFKADIKMKGEEEQFKAVNDFNISFKGKTNNLAKETEQEISLNYSSDVNFPITYRKIEDKLGIQTKYIGKNFVAIDTADTDTMSNTIIEFINQIKDVFDKADETKQIEITEQEKEQIINRYTEVLMQSIGDEKFSKVEETSSTGYKLTLTLEDMKNITIKLLETLKDDELALDKINQYAESLGAQDKVEKSEIEEVIESFNETEIEENQQFEITVYSKKGKLSKLKISTEEIVVTMDKIKGNNQNSTSISFEIKNDDNVFKFLIAGAFNGLETMESVQETYQVTIQVNEEESITYMINNNVSFAESVDIENFTEDNSIILNDVGEEQLTNFLEAVEQRITEVNKQQMEELGLEESQNPLFNLFPLATTLDVFDSAQTSRTNNDMKNIEEKLRLVVASATAEAYDEKYSNGAQEDVKELFIKNLNRELTSEYSNNVKYNGNSLSENNQIDKLPATVEIDGYEFEIGEDNKVTAKGNAKSNGSNVNFLSGRNELDATNVTQTNAEYEMYANTNSPGVTTKGLMTIISENNEKDGYKIKEINFNGEEYEATRENISFIKQEISTEKNYKIEFEKEENTGAIYRAVINEK